MNPNFLKSHELAYEVSLRLGRKVIDTVERNRKTLRGALSQENANRSFVSLVDVYTFDENFSELELSLNEIADLIASISSTSSRDDYSRLSTRLTHCSGRIHRLQVNNDVETSHKQSLLFKLYELESDLSDKQLNNDTPACSTPVRYSTNVPGSAVISPSVSSNTSKRIPVFKWGIKKFSGKEPLIPFLELVDTLKTSRCCSDNDLFDSAADLFDQDAWTWWHNHVVRGSFNNWSDLVAGLKQTFYRLTMTKSFWTRSNLQSKKLESR
ncbi:hypothetical protein WA026_013284 [Henosepilachna vigintioctopunctata]|uniref:Retrotransposon gag domain-containing protein n=1 Tax=Henosepilachna vigintioctopunctata TaxID=420089 RepID=A0AAW1UEL2_9CUCU